MIYDLLLGIKSKNLENARCFDFHLSPYNPDCQFQFIDKIRNVKVYTDCDKHFCTLYCAAELHCTHILILQSVNTFDVL